MHRLFFRFCSCSGPFPCSSNSLFPPCPPFFVPHVSLYLNCSLFPRVSVFHIQSPSVVSLFLVFGARRGGERGVKSRAES
jgi:hypothetical protein